MTANKLPRLGLVLTALILLSAVYSLSQEVPREKTTDVSISELGLHPEKFDGHLVRVKALLVFGWEGDNFLSDPNPQNMPSGRPAYLWFYCRPDRERQVYRSIRLRSTVYGWFTGYFHFVSAPQVNGMFNPGHLQFEAIEAFILEGQPRSLAGAIREGNLEEVRKILRSGAKVNVRDEYDLLPLFEAIMSGYANIAEELLAAGADPKLTESDRSTSLMMAAWHGNVRIAKVLLDHGVSVNATDVHGNTALIFASQTCPDGKMVQILLDAGANPNAKTTNGVTSLMAAVGNPIVAEKLLKVGADPAAKTDSGDTVENEACDRGEKGHYEVCVLVRQALGKK